MTIEETEPSAAQHARKRAAVALGSLAAAAVLMVALFVALGGSPSSHSTRTAVDTVPAPVRTHSPRHPSPSASGRRTASASASPTALKPASKSAKPKPHRLAGDAGNVLKAINELRTRHGLRPVAGAVTAAAVGCAASSGDSSACPSSYFWEPVSGPDGTQVVQKIVAHQDGAQFLLDPRMKRIQIGWKPIGNGGWECAVVGGY